MIKIYERGKTIVIDTQVGKEEKQCLLRRIGDSCTLDNNITISEVATDENFINDLPYTERKHLLLVDLKNSKEANFSLDLLCNKDEYYFVVERRCFNIHNLFVRYGEDELLEHNVVKDEIPFLLTKKFRTLQHKAYGDERLKAALTSKQIESLLNYSIEEKKNIDHILEHPNLRLINLFDSEDTSLNVKQFYIVVGKLKDDKSKTIGQEKSLFTSYGKLNLNKINLGELTEEQMKGYGKLTEVKGEKEDVNKGSIVVVVHGLGSSCIKGDEISYPKLISYLLPKFHVFMYDYLTINQPIDVSASIFAQAIKKLKGTYKNKDIIVVAHSMGGIVSRAAYVKYEAPITFLITAGTPHKGALLASAPQLASLALRVFSKKKMKRRDFVDSVRGRYQGLRDLGNRTNYIKKLNDTDNGTKRPYFFLAGNNWCFNDRIVSIRNAVPFKTENPENSIIDRWNHFNYFEKNIKSTFNSISKKIGM